MLPPRTLGAGCFSGWGPLARTGAPGAGCHMPNCWAAGLSTRAVQAFTTRAVQASVVVPRARVRTGRDPHLALWHRTWQGRTLPPAVPRPPVKSRCIGSVTLRACKRATAAARSMRDGISMAISAHRATSAQPPQATLRRARRGQCTVNWWFELSKHSPTHQAAL